VMGFSFVDAVGGWGLWEPGMTPVGLLSLGSLAVLIGSHCRLPADDHLRFAP
jgi:hypothetical protein